MGKSGRGTANTLTVASSRYEKKPTKRSTCRHKATAIMYKVLTREIVPFANQNWLKMIEALIIKVSTFSRIADVGGIMNTVL